ncbi:MAG: hypothetical protein V2I63_02405, partial [Pseudomonadales bacterium]|nr:hypothetical protein [Pseudomonadales bacterium]
MSLGAFDPQRLRLPRALFPFVSDTQLPEEEIRARLLMAIAASIGVPALIVFALQALLVGHVAIAVLELVCALLCVTIYLVTRRRLMRL